MTDTTLPVPLPEQAIRDIANGLNGVHPLLGQWERDLRLARAVERACMAPLQEENAKLKTVMIAAAEEIAAHWAGHCDAEGYGPVNLLHRLEEGIPSEYGYTAGAFKTLQERADALQAENDENHALREKLSGLLSATVIALRGEPPPLTLWSWHDLPERAAAAIAAIDVMQRAAKENAARADALEEALRELVGARTEMDERAWTPDGFVDAKLYEAARDRMKSAWAAARSLINPTGGES